MLIQNPNILPRVNCAGVATDYRILVWESDGGVLIVLDSHYHAENRVIEEQMSIIALNRKIESTIIPLSPLLLSVFHIELSDYIY